MWLRVTHILYTVCGNTTTSSANGQSPIAPISRLASHRGRARPPCGAIYDVAIGRVRPLRDDLNAGYRTGRARGHAPGCRADATASASVDRARDFRDAIHETSDGVQMLRHLGNARRGCSALFAWSRDVHQEHAASQRRSLSPLTA